MRYVPVLPQAWELVEDMKETVKLRWNFNHVQSSPFWYLHLNAEFLIDL